MTTRPSASSIVTSAVRSFSILVLFVFDGATDSPQGLTQVVSGVGFHGIGPEYASQPLAPVPEARIEDQVRKEGLCGARGDFQPLTFAPETELAEEPDF